MNAQDYRTFLAKFASNQHSKAEHQRFLDWLRQAPDEQTQTVLEEYEQIERLRLPEIANPIVVAKIEARLDALDRAKVSAKSGRRWWFSAAAALLLVASSYFLKVRQALMPAVVYNREWVKPGQTKTITLEDGSVVVLNTGSRFAYPEHFASAHREVYLEGEAFFKVAKNPNQPFIIHSNGMQTQVVGTSFNVYAYKQASQMRVTVLTGKVVVTDSLSGQQVALLPAQQGVFDKQQRKLSVAAANNPQQSIAWQQGELIFEDASLPEVVDKLGVRYGTSIQLRDSQLKKCRLTVSFKQESLAEALQVVAALTNSTYANAGGKVELRGRGCL